MQYIFSNSCGGCDSGCYAPDGRNLILCMQCSVEVGVTSRLNVYTTIVYIPLLIGNEVCGLLLMPVLCKGLKYDGRKMSIAIARRSSSNIAIGI